MSKVIVKNVQVINAPGFRTSEGPALNDFEDGLNIIYGNNGSGKTTLSKCLQSSLWENKEKDKLQVEVDVKLENNDWKLRRKNTNLEQRNLQTNRLEKLPNRKDEYSSNYNFSIIDLLEGDAKPLKEKINTELNFGVDFDKIKNSLNLLKGENLRKSVSNKYYQLTKELEKAQKEIEGAEALRQDRDKINAEIKELSEKIKGLDDIERKIVLKTKMLEKAELKAKLDSYPPFMRYLSPEKLKAFEDKEKNLTQDNTRLKQKEELIELCVEELKDTGFLETKVDEKSYEDYLIAKINQLEGLENNYNELQKEEKLKKEELSRWLDDYKFFVGTLPLEDGVKASIDKLASLAKEYEPRANSKQSIKLLIEKLGAKGESSEEKIDKISSSLRKKIQSKNKLLVFILYFLILGLGIASALLSPWYTLGIVGILIFLFFKDQKRVDYELIEKDIRQLTDLKVIKERNEAIQKAERDYEESIAALDEWILEWKKTYEFLGTNPMENTLSSAKFYDFGEVLKQGFEKKEAYEKSKDALDLSQNSCDSFKEELSEKFSINCLNYDFFTLKEKLKIEKENFKKYLEKKKEKLNLEKDKKDLEESIKNNKEKIADFWEELGLMPSESYKVEQFRGKYDDYKEQNLHFILLSNELDEKEFLTRELYSIKIETLQEQKDELKSLQKRKENLIGEEGNKAAKYEAAIKSEAYKNKLKEIDKEKEKLNEIRASELERFFCREICEEVENSNVENNQPAIIDKANEWLSKITKNTFKLFFDKDFFVRDTNKNDNYTFDELSSGTRVQVFLSLRLGALEFLEEGGASYPLFFDETLANSDDDRSFSISQALYELSKQRQVFYFTAQSEEVNKLKQQYKDDLKKVGYFNLDEKLKEQKQRLKPFEVFEKKKRIQFPDRYEDCPKVLKLSKPDLFENITNLSIYYAFDEVKDLSYYYDLGIKKIGQLKISKKPEIQERIRALWEAQTLAKIGRCRVLHKEDLENTQIEGINTDANYWNDILEKVSLSNSGLELVRQMKTGVIKRLSDDKIENIKEYLIKEKYYNEEKPLEEGEILLKILEKKEIINQEKIKLLVTRYLGMVL